MTGDRIFHLNARGTTLIREIQAGATTFAAMAYVLAVNPAILAQCGMDHPALITVTALTAAISTFLMAALTNLPLALAPGMGINAFFTFTICLGHQLPWQEALGMVFFNGGIFLVLSISGIRERMIQAIPYPLKLAITCGIGLFIAFIGLQKGGLVIADPATLVTHGDFRSPEVWLCLAGVGLTLALVARRIPGAIVLGMLTTAAAGLFIVKADGAPITALPAHWVSLPADPTPLVGQLSFGFLKSWSAWMHSLPLILTLLLVDMFDNLGTLIGVTQRAGMIGPDGKLPQAGRAFLADSIATLLSALFGTSTVVSYVESASGVEAGGRTGLTAITTGVLMLLALFLTPIILALPAAATAPALIVVGVFMLQSIAQIKMADFAVAAPAAIILLSVPLTYSISTGIGLGLIMAACLALVRNQPRELPITGYILALVFLLSFFHIFPFHG